MNVLKTKQAQACVHAVFAAAMLLAGASVQAQGEEAAPIVQTRPLVLYGNDFIDELPPLFQQATGFTVTGVHFSGGPLLARVEAEQANPQWDVLLVDGHGSIRSFGDRGLLLTGWRPENLDNLSELGLSLVPEDFAYFPVGIHAAGLIAYNKNLVADDTAPRTWSDFFAYNGPVGHADPAIAAPGYPLVSAFFEMWGIQETEQLYTQRFRSGLRVYPRNPAVLEALLAGEIHVAALQEHNAYGALLDGEPIGVIWPDEGAPASLRVVAINPRSDNLEVAKAFVEFLLTTEAQNALLALPGNDSFFTGLSQGTTTRSERRQGGAFLLPPAEWAAAEEARIKTWFADQSVL